MCIFSPVPRLTYLVVYRVPKVDMSKARFLISAHNPINTPLPFLQLFSCQLVATSCFWYLGPKTLEPFLIFPFFPTSHVHTPYITPINNQCTSEICPGYGHLSVTLVIGPWSLPPPFLLWLLHNVCYFSELFTGCFTQHVLHSSHTGLS